MMRGDNRNHQQQESVILIMSPCFSSGIGFPSPAIGEDRISLTYTHIIPSLVQSAAGLVATTMVQDDKSENANLKWREKSYGAVMRLCRDPEKD